MSWLLLGPSLMISLPIPRKPTCFQETRVHVNGDPGNREASSLRCSRVCYASRHTNMAPL